MRKGFTVTLNKLFIQELYFKPTAETVLLELLSRTLESFPCLSLTELQQSRLSAQGTKCLVFLVSVAHRAVQGAHRDDNVFENGEMEAKVKG